MLESFFQKQIMKYINTFLILRGQKYFFAIAQNFILLNSVKHSGVTGNRFEWERGENKII